MVVPCLMQDWSRNILMMMGIDGIIKEDKLGLDRIYIQAKRYSTANTIGKPQIQQFVGALDEQQVKAYS